VTQLKTRPKTQSANSGIQKTKRQSLKKLMKTRIKELFLLSTLITGPGGLLCDRMEAQTYTFGTQVQSTNTASMTYNSGTGEFNYTDAANDSDDKASVPLTGSAASLISSANSWHASLTVNVSAKSMTATSGLSPQDGMGISVFHLQGTNEYYASIVSGQVNNTGSADPDFPAGVYGTGGHFLARINGINQTTTPLGNSVLENGDSILPESGATNTSATAENVGAVTNVVTLSYDPSTKTVTGYCNGVAAGSYSIAGWGSNPALTFYVFGASGEGISVTSGTDTGANFNAGEETFGVPQLAGIQSGTNIILMWPTNATGFTLQFSTNVAKSAAWSTVSPAPVVVNGQNTVTNGLTGTQKFFRLLLP
jgi:hypothetical protein